MSTINALAHLSYLQAARQRRLVPLNADWGVEVRGFDFDGPLTSTLTDCLRSLLREYQVLFFRRCRLSQSRLLDLAALFGEPEAVGDAPRTHGYYRVLWQADASYRDQPYAVALVHTLASAAQSCEQSFLSSAQQAYESLPEVIRRRLEGMTAVHRVDCQAHVLTENAGIQASTRGAGVAEHPVLGRHPFTGRSYLNVNEAFTHRIVGLPANESRQLLELLTQQFYRPDHQLRLKWRPDSLAIWDARVVQHYGPPGDSGRLLVRAKSRLSGQP